MKLSQTLKALLEQRGMTVRDLGRHVKLPESTIKTWLRGANPRSMEDVRACARFFDVSLEYLLFGEEDAPPRTLQELPLEEVFDGWLRVKVQRAVNIRPKKDS